MDTIIAGRFETYAAARKAEAVLIGSDFTAADIYTFYVTPPGQHATYPIGGNEYADDGSRHAGNDAAKEAAVGGDYTGSLNGALRGMGDEEKKDAAGTSESRKAGVLVAVRAEGDSAAQSAREIFKQSGASDIEVASGTWRDGTWVDFDPTAGSSARRYSPEVVLRRSAARSCSTSPTRWNSVDLSKK